jgi:hypothetical protein
MSQHAFVNDRKADRDCQSEQGERAMENQQYDLVDASNRCDLARSMADKGVAVIRCDPNSKVPYKNISWKKSMTKDPDVISGWFKENPDLNYGVNPGEGFVVIDLDVKDGKNGVELFDFLCEQNDPAGGLDFIETFKVKTPSGGYHIYFKTPHPLSNGHSLPEGIDVRGAGGSAVVPGSKIGGTEYVVDNDAEIAEVPSGGSRVTIIHRLNGTFRGTLMTPANFSKTLRPRLRGSLEILIPST